MAENKAVTKALKKLHGEFLETAQAMTTEDIKKKMVELERAKATMAQTMQADEKLTQTQEMVKEMKAPYVESIKESDAAITVYCSVLDERGAG